MKTRILGLGLPLSLILVLLVGLMVLSSLAVQAGGEASRPARSEEAVTITFWYNHTSMRETFLQRMIDEFNATNPYSITVVGEYAGGYGEIYDKIIRGLNGVGPLPNAVAAYPNQLADYARYGAVRFLDDYLDDPVLSERLALLLTTMTSATLRAMHRVSNPVSRCSGGSSLLSAGRVRLRIMS